MSMNIDWQEINERLVLSQSKLSELNSRDIQHWPDLLEQRARRLAERTPPEQKSQKTYLLCLIQSECYAVALHQLKEVAPFKTCTFLPLAPAALLGVSNQRGVMISVLDLAALLGLSPLSTDRSEGYLLFLRSTPPVALRVDALSDFIHLEETELTPCPQVPYLKGLAGDVQVLNLSVLSQHSLLQNLSFPTHYEQE
jgi:chemotaxis signal transduction protein